MKILACHNYYQQRGGEDCSFEQEAELLTSNGHQVVRYTLHNDQVDRVGKVALAGKTIWNRAAYRDVLALIRRERPDVMHCTNTFPLLSPAIYYAARRERVPVIQALRNYRLLCPKAQFLRDGKVCEDCLNKLIPWAAVQHRCYRDDRAATMVLSAMLVTHRLWRTWERQVTLFYTPSEFARQTYIRAGFQEDRVMVKPNFTTDNVRVGTGSGGYAVYVGRLSPEKGISTLLSAWSQLDLSLRLKVIGDGPDAQLVQQAAAQDSRIEWLGLRSITDILEILADATCLVFPSIWYETFGRTIIESFSVATPVVVARMGAMAELVEEHHNGLLFTPGDAVDLVDKVRQLCELTSQNSRLRQGARETYERLYTPQQNYDGLLAIYQQALRLDGVSDATRQLAVEAR
ncbi:MAG TPA: glycosyltransferase [Pirellulaceae bacterium]|nr:glycosyltransferase [Pirellulaceae bacterium]